MSKESKSSALADLGLKISEDGELREKFKNAVDIQKVVSIAKDAGFDISPEQISSFFSARRAELSDSELDLIAGGQMNEGRGCFWTCVRNSRALG
jgi:predicted ribosomally synthesized peptide with nif11-like leader